MRLRDAAARLHVALPSHIVGTISANAAAAVDDAVMLNLALSEGLEVAVEAVHCSMLREGAACAGPGAAPRGTDGELAGPDRLLAWLEGIRGL